MTFIIILLVSPAKGHGNFWSYVLRKTLGSRNHLVIKRWALRFYISDTKYNDFRSNTFNPLKAELNPICYLLALLAHHFLHVSRIRVKSLTLRLLMSYIWSTYS